MKIKYPYSKQNINNKDIEAVIRSLKSDYLTQGLELKNFEKELAKKMGCNFATVVSSGTAALHISYRILGIGKSSNIVTSPITFLSTANAAKFLNSKVYFTDVDKSSGLMTEKTLVQSLNKLNAKVSVVVPVHLAGRSCEMYKIHMEAKKRNLKIIEDASHAPLAKYNDNKGNIYNVGSCAHSEITIMSLHAIKHIAMGEGGVILTNSIKIQTEAQKLRNHGMIKDNKLWIGKAAKKEASWYYEMHDIGWNYRATEMQCALGRAQLKKLESSILERQKIAKFYEKLLKDTDNICIPNKRFKTEKHSFHLYSVQINFSKLQKSKIEIINYLKKYGIGTQVHYIPLFYQPYYKENEKKYPSAAFYYEGTLSLPMYVGLEKKDIIYIVRKLKEAIN